MHARWSRFGRRRYALVDDLEDGDGPKHQSCAYIDGEPVRRLLLEKTRRHVYYVVFEREKLVRIVTIWGGPREHGPKL
jgi:hypothetical protein